MSTSQLRNVATNQVAEKPKDLAALMASAAVQQQIKMALPRHMTAERLARIATTEMRRIPALAQCTPLSFLGAVIQCAQLGLEPGNALGHVYLIPFGKEVQVIVGYRGFIDLARRSGQIVSIEARAVYDGDKFDCVLGLDSTIEHVPDWQNPNRADPAKLRFVYSVAKLKDGGLQFDVMSRAEVDAIRARSKSGKSGPWVTDYAAMALKTVVRRLFKFLPVSIEIQTAVGLDEQGDLGQQQSGAILDGNFTEVTDEPTPIAGEEVAPAPTYAELMDRINGTTDAGALAMIDDDVDLVADEKQRAELKAAIAKKVAK